MRFRVSASIASGLLWMALGVSVSAAAVPQAIQITGAVAHPQAWTGAQLRLAFGGDIQSIRYALKGKTHTAHCIPLLALLRTAEPEVNTHVKNQIIQWVVIAQGRDGYAAVFSLAEILPQFGHASVWVALDQDGKALATKDAPAELLVPGDVKPARWVHALASVTIVNEVRAASHAD